MKWQGGDIHWDSRVSINGEERPEFFFNVYPVLLGLLDNPGEVMYAAFGVWILEQNSSNVLTRKISFQNVLDVNLDAEGKGSGGNATGIKLFLCNQI